MSSQYKEAPNKKKLRREDVGQTVWSFTVWGQGTLIWTGSLSHTDSITIEERQRL